MKRAGASCPDSFLCCATIRMPKSMRCDCAENAKFSCWLWAHIEIHRKRLPVAARNGWFRRVALIIRCSRIQWNTSAATMHSRVCRRRCADAQRHRNGISQRLAKTLVQTTLVGVVHQDDPIEIARSPRIVDKGRRESDFLVAFGRIGQYRDVGHAQINRTGCRAYG